MLPVRKLYPSPAKSWLFLLVSIAVFLSTFFFKMPNQNWLRVAFSVAILVFLAQLSNRASWLLLTEHGFVVRTLFRSQPLEPWSAVSEFRVSRAYPGSTSMVVYNSQRYRRNLIARFNQLMLGGQAALPDTYGLQMSELAQLLNTYRSTYARQG